MKSYDIYEDNMIIKLKHSDDELVFNSEETKSISNYDIYNFTYTDELYCSFELNSPVIINVFYGFKRLNFNISFVNEVSDKYILFVIFDDVEEITINNSPIFNLDKDDSIKYYIKLSRRCGYYNSYYYKKLNNINSNMFLIEEDSYIDHISYDTDEEGYPILKFEKEIGFLFDQYNIQEELDITGNLGIQLNNQINKLKDKLKRFIKYWIIYTNLTKHINIPLDTSISVFFNYDYFDISIYNLLGITNPIRNIYLEHYSSFSNIEKLNKVNVEGRFHVSKSNFHYHTLNDNSILCNYSGMIAVLPCVNINSTFNFISSSYPDVKAIRSCCFTNIKINKLEIDNNISDIEANAFRYSKIDTLILNSERLRLDVDAFNNATVNNAILLKLTDFMELSIDVADVMLKHYKANVIKYPEIKDNIIKYIKRKLDINELKQVNTIAVTVINNYKLMLEEGLISSSEIEKLLTNLNKLREFELVSNLMQELQNVKLNNGLDN